MHQLQRYPRPTGSGLLVLPDRMTMSIWLLAFPLDVFDKLFEKPEEQGFTAEQVLRDARQDGPFRVGRRSSGRRPPCRLRSYHRQKTGSLSIA